MTDKTDATKAWDRVSKFGERVIMEELGGDPSYAANAGAIAIVLDHVTDLERMVGCLLDHYMTSRGQNDGQESFHTRDQVSEAAEALVPSWRQRRDEWKPKRTP